MSWLKAKDWASGVEYSSLFHSGLRAISLRPRDRRARVSSSSSSSREKSRETSPTPSLSSRLLKRNTTRTRHPSLSMSTSTESDLALLPHTSKVTRPRPSSMFVRPTKEMADTWSSEAGFFEIGGHPKFPEGELGTEYLLPPIELGAVRSLSGSRPFFVDLGEMDAIAVPPMKGESFLSLSDPPDGLLYHTIPRRRPVSMLSMPLPSRRSSSYHRTRETSLDESSPELKEYGQDDEQEEEIWLDDERDWRQFHVEWVRNIR